MYSKIEKISINALVLQFVREWDGGGHYGDGDGYYVVSEVSPGMTTLLFCRDNEYFTSCPGDLPKHLVFVVAAMTKALGANKMIWDTDNKEADQLKMLEISGLEMIYKSGPGYNKLWLLPWGIEPE